MNKKSNEYKRPVSLRNRRTHYCTGCGHGTVHKLMAECMDEFNIREKTILIAPVGCAVLAYDYIYADGLEAAHGRAPAVATGVKRVHPDKIVISYQGDGDLLAIGMGETIHAANRGENITVIFINNAIYGMTGGQMAPTTMEGQITTTTPEGRNPQGEGYPIRACEIINTLENPYYIERCSVHNVKQVIKTKKALQKAFQYQIEGRGYTFIEILSMCPTNWGMNTRDSAKWIEEVMIPYYPLGLFRDKAKQSKTIETVHQGPATKLIH